MSDSQEELVGQVLASQFRILRKLGVGGMGAVYLAEQIEMDRKVVVKVLHPEMTSGNSVALERFRREAKAVAQLNHPNIVQVFVFGQAENGQMYLAMEYIDGRDLSVDLAEGPMAQPRALRILDQACSALIEAHGAGIVHRDLKPENIMLSDRHGNPDYVKVLDFGIAKLHDGGNNPTLTQAGSVFGTPRYMSPEQVKGEPVDARSDIYALGIILYEMLVGRHPFVATTTIDYLMKHVNEEVPAPSAEGLDIQPRIESLLLKTLEKDPSDRYQSVAELQRDVRVALRDFSEAVRGFPSGSSPVQRQSNVPRPAQGTRPPAKGPYVPPGSGPKKGVPAWIWAMIGVLLVGGIVGVVIAVAPSGGKQGLAGGLPPKEPIAANDDPDPDKGTDDPDPDEGTDDPDEGTDKEPIKAEVEGPAPTTSIEVGESVDGFPLPKDARSTGSTPQGEMFETAVAPRDLVGFYRAKLHGKYKLRDVPNGLEVSDPDSPFSYITFSMVSDRTYLVLSRNALAPQPEKKGPPPPAFGVDFPPDATLTMKTEQAVIMRSRQKLTPTCDKFIATYGSVKGAMVWRDDQGQTPLCTITVTNNPDVAWMSITVMSDPMTTGALMITVVPKMF